MKANVKGRLAIVAAAALAVALWALTVNAATSYSDYAVYGEHGVMIGVNSEVVGLVGARYNNTSPVVYPGQPAAALNMNGGAAITGTARVGANATVANSVTITQLYYVGTFSHGSSFTGSATQVADADLPSASLAAQSAWPGGLGTGCPTGGTAHTGLGNGFSLTLTPGSYGAIQGGGGGDLTFNGAGDYFIQSLQLANGTTFHVTTPGVRVFVCEDVQMGSGTDVLPATLLPGEFTWEVYGSGVTAGTNAFTSGGGDWIGNVLVPSRGIHYGNGSESGTYMGYMWADHVDIEHSLVATKLAKKSGVKWNDINGDGVRQQGEPGLAGWTIQLRDATNTSVVDTKLTDANGYYEFTDIPAGTYYVCELAQPNWVQTYPNALTPNPIPGKDDVTSLCPAPATYGYVIVAANGDNLGGDDFGNYGEPRKSGLKFNDLNGDGVRQQGEPGLPGWTINLLDTNFQLVDSKVTDANGAYEFLISTNGTYFVCETPQAGWNQTMPNALTPGVPGKDEVTALCPPPYAPYGYMITVTYGDNLTDNLFGNVEEQGIFCEKQPVQAVLDPLTGLYKTNKGPDVVVRVDLGQSVQDAVDNTGDANGDGYIIIGVSAHGDGSLGGSANQKVAVWKDYTEAKPFALIGCSVTLTGGGTDPAVWVKSTANAKNVTVNGRATDIFVMDLHGANSAVGVQADGNYRYLRNEYGTASTTGIKVVGNYNTIHNGKGEANSGDGVYAQGNYNLVTDTDSFSNGANGFNVVGDYNQLLKLDAGDKGKGSGADGVHVVGNRNTISENGAFANGGDGIDVAGNSNTLTKNRAGDKGKGNTGSGIRVVGASNTLTENKASSNMGDGFVVSGGMTSATANLLKNNLSNTSTSGNADYENLGAEFRLTNYIKNNGGGNKIDSVALPSAAKIASFPTSGATFNYSVTTAGE